ncbi:MAG: ribonuclease III [Betaproteobacteria bacterium]|nr:ribonuclease III [Betaproteobacteria bacterium]
MEPEVTDLEHRLGYAFRDPALLSRALTHRSHGAEHNERLEFVGDAVLNCVVAAALFRRFPQLPEGDLSRIRANLVNRDCLLQRAQDLALAGLVRLGEGEHRSGGASRPSILSDATEAVFGAVFLDGGFDAARAVIEQCYAEAIQAVDPGVSGKDPKTRLQEWLQAKGMPVPEYGITAVDGEAHKQSFTVSCRIKALGRETTGHGASRRIAEQEAARAALAELAP